MNCHYLCQLYMFCKIYEASKTFAKILHLTITFLWLLWNPLMLTTENPRPLTSHGMTFRHSRHITINVLYQKTGPFVPSALTNTCPVLVARPGLASKLGGIADGLCTLVDSLHLTTMCLQYRPTVVAAVCIHLACKWSNWSVSTHRQGLRLLINNFIV